MNQCPWGLPAPKPPGADGKEENIQPEKRYLFIGARFFDSALGSLRLSKEPILYQETTKSLTFF